MKEPKSATPPPAHLAVYEVHKDLEDYPERFVVRKLLTVPGEVLFASKPHCAANTLAEARASIPKGLLCMPRRPRDASTLVETWF